jgi:hypothetical protein
LAQRDQVADAPDDGVLFQIGLRPVDGVEVGGEIVLEQRPLFQKSQYITISGPAKLTAGKGHRAWVAHDQQLRHFRELHMKPFQAQIGPYLLDHPEGGAQLADFPVYPRVAHRAGEDLSGIGRQLRVWLVRAQVGEVAQAAQGGYFVGMEGFKEDTAVFPGQHVAQPGSAAAGRPGDQDAVLPTGGCCRGKAGATGRAAPGGVRRCICQRSCCLVGAILTALPAFGRRRA